MYTLKVENTLKNILRLTQNENDFQVLNVEGLNPPPAQLNRSKAAGMDGSKFNSATLDERNLVLTVKLRGNIERNRQRLYSMFPTKEWCKIYYTNGSLSVFIEGYAEVVECGLFTSNEVMQISIICTNPYFKSLDEIVEDLSRHVELFEFPFAINSEGMEFSTIETSLIHNVYNSSESETGVNIVVEVLRPISKISIIGVTYGETFTINHAFQVGDTLRINTNKGEKSVTLLRQGTEINIFSSIEKGSTFFVLRRGDNIFTYSANNDNDNDAVTVKFKFHKLYRGV